MTQKIHGPRLEIWFVEDDPEQSWKDAMNRWRAKPEQQEKVYAQMFTRLQKLADGGQLRSPDHFNTEGNLPNGKRYYAVKAGKIRAYGWYSDRHKGVFYVSHFAFKQGKKLSRPDDQQVQGNWHQIERSQK